MKIYRVSRPGDSAYYKGELVPPEEFERVSAQIIRQGGEAPSGALIEKPSKPEPVLVQLEDISPQGIQNMTVEAARLGGAMISQMSKEASAMFAFPARAVANDFARISRRMGYLTTKGAPSILPADMLLRDIDRIRRATTQNPASKILRKF
jgi:hypothetical protein